MKTTLKGLAELFLSPSLVSAEIWDGSYRHFACALDEIPADLESREVEALDLGCDCIVVYLLEEEG